MNARALAGMLGVVLAAGIVAAAPARTSWTPPKGWDVHRDTQPPIVLLWMQRGKKRVSPNINVMREPQASVASEVLTTREQFRNMKVKAAETPLTCVTGISVRLDYDMAVLDHKLTFRAYILPDGARGSYIATYTRPAGTHPDPAALQALDTICHGTPP